jgi:hypothetical protein
MGLFSAFYRVRNRNAKMISQIIKEKNLYRELGMNSSGDLELVMRTCKLLYKGVFLNAGSPSREDCEEFDKLIEESAKNEWMIHEYLKSRVWAYEDLCNREIERFFYDAKFLMDHINGDVSESS